MDQIRSENFALLPSARTLLAAALDANRVLFTDSSGPLGLGMGGRELTLLDLLSRCECALSATVANRLGRQGIQWVASQFSRPDLVLQQLRGSLRGDAALTLDDHVAYVAETLWTHWHSCSAFGVLGAGAWSRRSLAVSPLPDPIVGAPQRVVRPPLHLEDLPEMMRRFQVVSGAGARLSAEFDSFVEGTSVTDLYGALPSPPPFIVGRQRELHQLLM